MVGATFCGLSSRDELFGPAPSVGKLTRKNRCFRIRGRVFSSWTGENAVVGGTFRGLSDGENGFGNGGSVGEISREQDFAKIEFEIFDPRSSRAGGSRVVWLDGP